MDDYNISTLVESKNEWSARLTNIMAPCVVDGIKSVFDEAYKMCVENDEESKYLMTFQNLLNNIPKWSSQTVQQERERIVSTSYCNYLDDLITCVHITQLKALTSSRVGIKQKKINIDIPDINSFIHHVYINVARKVYTSVYLFEKDLLPLQVQKHNRELELMVKECILNTIRENVPVEDILKIYLDETQETDVEVEEKREIIPDEEAIKKQQEMAKKKELEAIKSEVEAKLKQESKSKSDLGDSLTKVNKSINTAENDDKKEVPSESDDDTNYTSDENEESDREDEKLTIHNDSESNIGALHDLNIKSLGDDPDPDKFDPDIIDIQTETVGNDDDNIELDIQELS